MRARIVIGGVLLSTVVLGAGLEAGLTHQQTLASGTDSAGTGSSGTDSADPDSAGTGTSGTGTSGSADSGSPASGSGSSSSTTTTAGYRDGTYTGTAVTTRYGDVQVRVTIAGGTITDVTAVQLTDAEGRSVQISTQSAPILRQEALSAQSASIDTVSGATYTSDGYRQSLQSALDQAG